MGLKPLGPEASRRHSPALVLQPRSSHHSPRILLASLQLLFPDVSCTLTRTHDGTHACTHARTPTAMPFGFDRFSRRILVSNPHPSFMSLLFNPSPPSRASGTPQPITTLIPPCHLRSHLNQATHPNQPPQHPHFRCRSTFGDCSYAIQSAAVFAWFFMHDMSCLQLMRRTKPRPFGSQGIFGRLLAARRRVRGIRTLGCRLRHLLSS